MHKMAKNSNNKLLEKWLNRHYLSKKTTEKLRKTFVKNRPYPYLELKNFLREDIAKKLLIALTKERFYEKESDLFSFFQTNDLYSLDNGTLKDFRNFLGSGEFISYMKSLTGMKFKKGKIDISGSLYKNTNYLLCHDDMLEGRNIAFLFYLSDLGRNDGGSLNLLNKKLKIYKKLMPKFNTFTFFKVSKISYHEVEEVYKDKQRIALGGWFHDK